MTRQARIRSVFPLQHLPIQLVKTQASLLDICLTLFE